jgi:hypothetical protein
MQALPADVPIADRSERVRPELFDAVEFRVGVLFDDDDECIDEGHFTAGRPQLAGLIDTLVPELRREAR